MAYGAAFIDSSWCPRRKGLWWAGELLSTLFFTLEVEGVSRGFLLLTAPLFSFLVLGVLGTIPSNLS